MTRIASILFGGVAAIATWALIASPGVIASVGVSQASPPSAVAVNRLAKTDRLSPAHANRIDDMSIARAPAARVTGRGEPLPSEVAPDARQAPAMPTGCTSALSVMVRQEPGRWLGTCFAQLTPAPRTIVN